MSIKKIVTHPGTAHGDDFLACCVLAAKFGVPIERREPTQTDLDDHETLVLDVGGRFEPEKNNFDHHHDLSLPCSFTQIIAWKLGAEEKFRRAFKWFDNVDFRDRNGVQRLGEKYGLSAEQMAELGSPVHTALLTIFEKEKLIEPTIRYQDEDHTTPLYWVMQQIGKDLIDHAEKYGMAWDRLEKCETREISSRDLKSNSDGIGYKDVKYTVHINPSDDITATGDFMREHKIAVMCSHDNRGSGWAILRSNDFPEINLAPLANDPHIAFAHKGGFIAKTKERVDVDVLIELLKTVI